jgi:hypothetical protein
MLERPIIARFTEYSAVIINIPASNGFTLNLVWMIPVHIPAAEPDNMAAKRVVNG